MEEPHPCTHPSFFPPSLPLHFPSFFFFPLFNCSSLPLGFSFLFLCFSSFLPLLPNLSFSILLIRTSPGVPIHFWSRFVSDGTDVEPHGNVIGSARFFFHSYSGSWRSNDSDPGGEPGANYLFLQQRSRFWNQRRWVWLLVLQMLLLSPL